MSNSTSLINFGDVSKPVTVLIEKISNAVGVLYQPTRIRNEAQANADAAMVEAKGQIEITDLHRRAMQRFVTEEAKKQQNIEDITRLALPDVKDDAQSEQVSEDWIADFFDKCRLISDKEMQQLWAKVLAGEANNPGQFSKRTVSLLSSLDKTDAQLFARLGSLACCFNNTRSRIPIVFDIRHDFYKSAGFKFSDVTHLNDIGLARYDSTAGFLINSHRTESPWFECEYFGTNIIIDRPEPLKFPLNVGHLLFSKSGQELLKICNPSPLAGFVDYVADFWRKQGCTTAISRNSSSPKV